MHLPYNLLRFAPALALTASIHAFASPPAASAVRVQPTSTAAAAQSLNLALTGVDGQTHKVSDWHGKVVLVNYWATWCPPCLHETPMLIELQKKYGPQGFQIVSIATQELDEETGNVLPVTEADTQTVKDFLKNTPFLKSHPIDFPIVMADEHVGAMVEGFGGHLVALPFSVLLDRNGRVIKIQTGELKPDDTEKAIQSALSDTADTVADSSGPHC